MLNMLIIFTSLLAMIGLNLKLEKPLIEVSRQNSAKNFDQLFLKIASVGNKRILSDIIWIQSLMESDVDHYSQRDLNNWLYLRFLSIVNLDPNFKEAYQVGGQYLSIIKDDKLGAKDIFDRGLAVYPEDFSLNWFAGFHYYYELKNNEKALEIFHKILHHPRSPKYLPSIVAKLESKGGDKFAALAILQESIKHVGNNEMLKQKFLAGIVSLQIEMDLECLNSGKKDCKLFTPPGFRYINVNGHYTTDKPFRDFKMYK